MQKQRYHDGSNGTGGTHPGYRLKLVYVSAWRWKVEVDGIHRTPRRSSRNGAHGRDKAPARIKAS